MTPMPPASETAATSSGLLHGYMAPQISGTSTPSWRVTGVSSGMRAMLARKAGREEPPRKERRSIHVSAHFGRVEATGEGLLVEPRILHVEREGHLGHRSEPQEALLPWPRIRKSCWPTPRPEIPERFRSSSSS